MASSPPRSASGGFAPAGRPLHEEPGRRAVLWTVRYTPTYVTHVTNASHHPKFPSFPTTAELQSERRRRATSPKAEGGSRSAPCDFRSAPRAERSDALSRARSASTLPPSIERSQSPGNSKPRGRAIRFHPTAGPALSRNAVALLKSRAKFSSKRQVQCAPNASRRHEHTRTVR